MYCKVQNYKTYVNTYQNAGLTSNILIPSTVWKNIQRFVLGDRYKGNKARSGLNGKVELKGIQNESLKNEIELSHSSFIVRIILVQIIFVQNPTSLINLIELDKLVFNPQYQV